MDWVVDLSFAHDDLTGALLVQHGVQGVIGYFSDNPKKNVTQSNLTDWLAHGLHVGMVFEDSTDDMRGGAISGDHHGATAAAQAQAIGYDLEHCVVFAADDENTTRANWPTVLAYMDAFARHVGQPGYYGDQDSIDWLIVQRPHWFYWQSESMSFGTGISRNAHLVQRYNDPRVAGLPLDANDIQRIGVPFMAVDGFTTQDRAVLNGIASQITAPSGFLARIGVNMLKTAQQIEQAGHADLAAQLATVQQALTTLETSETEQIVSQVVAHLTSSGDTSNLSASDVANVVLAELGQVLHTAFPPAAAQS